MSSATDRGEKIQVGSVGVENGRGGRSKKASSELEDGGEVFEETKFGVGVDVVWWMANRKGGWRGMGRPKGGFSCCCCCICGGCCCCCC